METHPAVQRYLAGVRLRQPIGALDWQRHTDLRPLSSQKVLDRITQLAGEAMGVPAVCVSLVVPERRLLTSSYGLPVPTALLLSHAFRKRLVASRRPLVVADGWCDPLTAHYPAVRDGTVRAYMGMPLGTADGRAVGILLAMDRKPRRWTASQLDLLERLSALIVSKVASGVVVRRTSQSDVSSEERSGEVGSSSGTKRDPAAEPLARRPAIV